MAVNRVEKMNEDEFLKLKAKVCRENANQQMSSMSQ